jgi:hypothetical protein
MSSPHFGKMREVKMTNMSLEGQPSADEANEAMLRLAETDPGTFNLLAETYGFHALSLRSKLTLEESVEPATGQPD